MNPIALVTANFGSIDSIKPLPAHPQIETFYYTDAEGASGQGWDHVIRPDYPRHDFNPRLRGRYFKCQLHRLPEVSRFPYLAWADSTLLFTDLSFLVAGFERLSRCKWNERVLLVPHPDRSTVDQEYRFIRDEIAKGNEYLTLRYADEKMAEQMEHFRARGWPAEAPLWCGTVFMLENSPAFHACWNDWWDQNLRYGLMDQLSLPMMLQLHGLTPQALGVNLWKNEFFSYVPHAKLM